MTQFSNHIRFIDLKVRRGYYNHFIWPSEEARESHTWWDICWAPAINSESRPAFPQRLMGFQTSRFLSEPFFKPWSLALALGFPQIQQLLSLTGIMVFLSISSSNYFYFSISLGPICARLCQNISLFLKKAKRSWDSTFLAKMRCVHVLQPELSVPAIPIKWCPMWCLLLTAVTIVLPRTTVEQTTDLLPALRKVLDRYTWKSKSVSCSQTASSIWNHS